LKDVDDLVACHPTFSLKDWIEGARAMGSDAAEKDYNEKNARTLVTVWGDSGVLTDNACRGWAGLISNYYAKRWILFIDEVIRCTEKQEAFDEKAFVTKCEAFEREFIEPSHRISYPQGGDGVLIARKLVLSLLP
jgi:alpha-N-acetylglucosaminidase